MLTLGNVLVRARRASCLVKDVGVSGQLEIWALDQMVTAVSGEMFTAGMPNKGIE